MRLPSFGLSFNNPDFVKLAESFGATGYRIENAEALLPQLKEALNRKGVQIVVCPIDYNKANKVLGMVKDDIIE